MVHGLPMYAFYANVASDVYALPNDEAVNMPENGTWPDGVHAELQPLGLQPCEGPCSDPPPFAPTLLSPEKHEARDGGRPLPSC